MIFGFVRKENIFLLQHYHPIRHIHCQIAVSEFPTDFDSWDMLTIIGSRSPISTVKVTNILREFNKVTLFVTYFFIRMKLAIVVVVVS